jgi:hypothetical protein
MLKIEICQILFVFFKNDFFFNFKKNYTNRKVFLIHFHQFYLFILDLKVSPNMRYQKNNNNKIQ